MSAKNQFRIVGGVVWIRLTQGKETCIDLADWEKVKGFRWCAIKFSSSGPYAVTKINRRLVLLHRFLVSGAEEVDHRDGEGLNNCRSNLRGCSRSQNNANRRLQKNNTSGFRGVSRSGWKWRARLGRSVLGYFPDISDAARAYNTAAKDAFGEFAQLNLVD